MLGRLAASLILFLLALELVFRFGRPSPRFQIIRNSRDFVLEDHAGIPIWHQRDEGQRANAECTARHPSALHVLFFGSSIFFGSGVKDFETFPSLLQNALDGRFGEGAVCVSNLAEPGFGNTNKLVLAKEQVPKHPRGIVVWEVWQNDPFPYVFLGDAAYSLRNARRDAHGYPDAFGVTPALNDFLFRHSRAYEYASLAFVPDQPGPEWNEIIRARVLPELDELKTLVDADGARLLLGPAPGLNKPFEEQQDDSMNAAIKAWAARNDVIYRPIATMLLDQDFHAIRFDPCCHYNAAGHRVLSERFFELLLPLVSERLSGRVP